MKLNIKNYKLSLEASSNLLEKLRMLYLDPEMDMNQAQETLNIFRYEIEGDIVITRRLNYIINGFEKKERLFIVRNESDEIIDFKIYKQAYFEIILHQLIKWYSQEPINKEFIIMLETGEYDFDLVMDYLREKSRQELIENAMAHLN